MQNEAERVSAVDAHGRRIDDRRLPKASDPMHSTSVASERLSHCVAFRVRLVGYKKIKPSCFHLWPIIIARNRPRRFAFSVMI